MDPYKPPKVDEIPVRQKSDYKAPEPFTCKYCGSNDISEFGDIVDKPGIIKFLFFGLFYLLYRSAFKCRDIYCRNCGKSYRHRTLWAYIAFFLLVLIILLNVCVES